MGLAGPRGDGDRLQQLRAILPTEVRIIRETHPLFGQLLLATTFKRWRGVLHLVVTLPDGSPGTIPADSSNVFGEEKGEAGVAVLSAEGFRHLHARVSALSPVKNQGRKQKRK